MARLFDLAVLRAGLRSPVDQRAIPAYCITFGKVAVGVLFLLLFGFTTTPMVWAIMIASGLLIPVGMLVSWLGNTRTGGAFQAISLVYGQGVMGFIFLLPILATPFPYQDGLLDAVDRAMGFDWLSLHQRTRAFAPWLLWAYETFRWQHIVVIAVLFATRQDSRAWQFVNASAVALLITSLLAMIVPAKGAAVLFGVSDGERWVPILDYLKGGGRELTGSMFTGLTTFPSYHAAACVLFAWALWTTWLRWPFLLLNMVMLLATVTEGSHYLAPIYHKAGRGFGGWMLM